MNEAAHCVSSARRLFADEILAFTLFQREESVATPAEREVLLRCQFSPLFENFPLLDPPEM